MTIHLHINRMVIDGLSLSPLDHHQVKAAVEAELGALLLTQGLGGRIENDGVISSVSGNVIEQQRNQSPTSLGRQIAHSVYGGLK